MFDIGFVELVLIGIVALVVIGPERLPAVATKLGHWVGRARQFIGSVRRDIDREIRQEEIRQALARNADLDEIKNIINDTKYTIEDEVNEAKQEYAVKARDDDPGRDNKTEQASLSQNNLKQDDLIKEQQEDFDDEDYGLTDHTDYALSDEEIDQQIAAEKHERRDDKAKG
ncbi:MAG: Sec-independent protein translocase protein TatB [Thioalkalispiraceae bacterium]|jgi:sec-independent protein translocase protein TatB